jgi:hypothetical protein
MSVGDQSGGRGVFLLKQSANIYTAMLILAFVFITVGCLFLFLEMKSYGLSVKVPQDAKVPQAMWSPARQSPMIAQNGFNGSMDRPEFSVL